MKLTLIYEDMHDDFMDVYGPPLTGDLEADWRLSDEEEDEINPEDQELVQQYFGELEDAGVEPDSGSDLSDLPTTFGDVEQELKRQADIRKKWYEGGLFNT